MSTMWSLSRRTRRRGMLLAGIVGLAALSLSILSHPRAKPSVEVVMTRKALAAGTVLSAADLTTAKLTAPGLPHTLTTVGAAIGHSLVFGMVADQALTTGDVVRSPELDGLKSNEVAVMLPVSLASSDDAQPNDRVNVIWLGGSTTSSAIAPGTVIATGLRVLSVLNQNGSPVTPAADANGLSASTPAVVEVAVPQAEAGNIAVAASSGRFWLALNPWAGPQDAVSTGTTAPPATNFGISPFSSSHSGNVPGGSLLPSAKHPTSGTSHATIPSGKSTASPTTKPSTTKPSTTKVATTGGHHG